ncbi:hypothetical protein SDC9_159218 [bioreactor metagenome]|uniref:Uncharacterized protein n=1 Tax=bioreactor metagenome TaxID=1076179 RepID=A0A645FEY6_9ZZZZ
MDIPDDFSVIDRNDACGAGRYFLRVGYHDDKLAGFGDVLDDVQHLVRRLRVQSSGRLIRNDDIRIVDQSAGDGHTLLLPAG